MEHHKTNNWIKIFLLVTFFAFFFYGCYKDNQQELYDFVKNISNNPNSSSSCDTTNITFSGMINPIIQQNCIVCHGSSYAITGGGISLQTGTDVAGNRAKIAVVITSTSNPMPPGGNNPLSSCQIKQIQMWINYGAPLN